VAQYLKVRDKQIEVILHCKIAVLPKNQKYQQLCADTAACQKQVPTAIQPS
jgi:hypothetical protein